MSKTIAPLKPSAALAEYERASECALKAYNYALEPLRAEHRRAERAAQEAYARALAKEQGLS
jgi:hypothetical protein